MSKMNPAYYYFTTQTEWKRYLQDLLVLEEKSLLNAVVMIYERQTNEEKLNDICKCENGIGFSKYDVEDLSRIARKIINKQEITKSEINLCKIKMPKYWKQLMEIIKIRILKEKEKEEIEKRKQEIERRKKVNKETFEISLEIMTKCKEEGIPCGYGICSDCVVERGELK